MILKNNRMGILGHDCKDGRVIVLPGANKISDVHWEEMEKHPMIKILVEEGTLEVISKGGKDGKVKSSLDSMSPASALELVKQTADKVLLEEWLESEKRAAVKKVIQEQLKKLEFSKPEPKAESKAE